MYDFVNICVCVCALLVCGCVCVVSILCVQNMRLLLFFSQMLVFSVLEPFDNLSIETHVVSGCCG